MKKVEVNNEVLFGESPPRRADMLNQDISLNDMEQEASAKVK